jgi:hypothetical protein
MTKEINKKTQQYKGMSKKIYLLQSEIRDKGEITFDSYPFKNLCNARGKMLSFLEEAKKTLWYERAKKNNAVLLTKSDNKAFIGSGVQDEYESYEIIEKELKD